MTATRATRVAGDPATELAYDPAAQAGREALAAEPEILRTKTAGKRFDTTEATDEQNQPAM